MVSFITKTSEIPPEPPPFQSNSDSDEAEDVKLPDGWKMKMFCKLPVYGMGTANSQASETSHMELISGGDFPDNIIQGIYKILDVTLWRYQNLTQRALVLDLICSAQSKYHVVTAKTVHGASLDYVGDWRDTSPIKALARHCLSGLAWSCSVVTQLTE